MGMLFPPASPLGIHVGLQFQESTVTHLAENWTLSTFHSPIGMAL